MMTSGTKTIEEIQSHLDSIVNLFRDLNVANQQVSDADALKNAYLGEIPNRVIHLKDNPFEREVKQSRQETEELKRENERLRARLELLESGNDMDVTRRIDDVVNANRQIQVLTRKVSELQQREAKILDSFRKTSREFREVCYLLLGYRVEALKDGVYRLSGIYAENESDKLLFKVAPDGTIQLLRNSYSDRLSEFISTYLEQADSFPAFLAAITLDLFKSSTQMSSMSMSLSTTIQPNLRYKAPQ